MVISYIFNTKIKDYTCYVFKNYINGVIHNFIVNNYNKYLDYSYKKMNIDNLYHSLIKGIENE